MTRKPLRIGSRGSELALWQSRWVQSELLRHHPNLATSLEVIRTKGDTIIDSPLSKIGDKGLFTREIEESLLDDHIDIAVHSLKDLPTELPAGLTIGAVSKREDVRDVFIPRSGNPARTLCDQPSGAVIATGSLRRRCQLLSLRPDLRIVDIRGNLNTRLRKLDDSDWSGMVLARAGVVRLGWEHRIGECIAPEDIVPAVGQGALALEIRENDHETKAAIESIRNWKAEKATLAERALLRSLEGGCQVPIGAFGDIDRGPDGTYALSLMAVVGSLDGKTLVRGKNHGNPDFAEELGRQLAAILQAGGADLILAAIRAMSASEGSADSANTVAP